MLVSNIASVINAAGPSQPEASVSAPTEERHPGTHALDAMSTLELLQTLNHEDARVALRLRRALEQAIRRR